MKKITLILVFTVLPFLGYSQSLFDKFEDMENVSSVIVNKSMINLVSSLQLGDADKETQDFLDIAKELKSLKVFITEDKLASAEMYGSVKKYLKSSKLEELMRVNDEDVNVKFYIKEGKDSNHVKELLMFVSGISNSDVEIKGRKVETVLLSLTGDIALDKIGALTNKMNLPKELNKASRSK
ncbi:DUF4252 domain-containing protein [Cellulophaga baltica]|uniref:DUF4252 domain-containing protein n=1 Tax=Cellulophaga TaxID=104264 RepID=UPI001C06A553|nr:MULTISPECIES: DUF4252 domain-containing protein [Cellulophaga]MBU2997418.1 DUF4252 domain-containing protein [Cellulophaga baltica]MDO6768815.1 DUF4252 domain-containing protein [Cellulophaga sp. 1_MG-2023]